MYINHGNPFNTLFVESQRPDVVSIEPGVTERSVCDVCPGCNVMVRLVPTDGSYRRYSGLSASLVLCELCVTLYTIILY